MKRKFERVVSLILAMAMCLSLVQVTTFASEVEADAAASISAQDTLTYNAASVKVEQKGDTDSNGLTSEVTVTITAVAAEDANKTVKVEKKYTAAELKDEANSVPTTGIYDTNADTGLKYAITLKHSAAHGQDEKTSVTVTIDGVAKGTVGEYTLSKDGHTFGTTANVKTPATCTTNGEIYYNCTYVIGSDTCTAVKTEVAKAGEGDGKTTHKLTKTKDAVAATAQADGNVEYWTCSECGAVFAVDTGKTVKAMDNHPDYYNVEDANNKSNVTKVSDIKAEYAKGSATCGVVLKYNNADSSEYAANLITAGVVTEKDGKPVVDWDGVGKSMLKTDSKTGVKTLVDAKGNVLAQEATCSAAGYVVKNHYKGQSTIDATTNVAYAEKVELAIVDHEATAYDQKDAATCAAEKVVKGKCRWCGKEIEKVLTGTKEDHKTVDATAVAAVDTSKWSQEQKDALKAFEESTKPSKVNGRDVEPATVSANAANKYYLTATGEKLVVGTDGKDNQIANAYVYDVNYCEGQETVKVYAFCEKEKALKSWDVKLTVTDAEKDAGAVDLKADKAFVKVKHDDVLKKNITNNEQASAQKATCDVDGYVGLIKKCPYCGDVLDSTDATKLARTGHHIYTGTEANKNTYTIVWGTAEYGSSISAKETNELARHWKNEFAVVPVCKDCGKPALVVWKYDDKTNTLVADGDNNNPVKPTDYVWEAVPIYTTTTLTQYTDTWDDAKTTYSDALIYVTGNDIVVKKTLPTCTGDAVYTITIDDVKNRTTMADLPLVADAQKVQTLKSNYVYDNATGHTFKNGVCSKCGTTESEIDNPEQKPEDTEDETVEKLVIKQEKRPVYNGKQQNVPFKVFAGDKELVEGKDYTVSTVNGSSKFTSVGKHKVNVTGIGDYAGMTVSGYVYIDPASIKNAVVTQTKTVYYNGSLQNTPVKVVLNGKTLKAGTDYTITNASSGAAGAQFTGVGTHKIYIKGAGNYTGTITYKTVIVAGKQSAVKVTPASKTLKVNKKKAQTVTLKVTGVKDKAKVTYKSSNSKVKVSAKGVVTVPKSFKGTAKITVKVAATTKYAGTSKTVTITVK